MRTLLPRIAFLALPLALLAVSACSGHPGSITIATRGTTRRTTVRSSVDRYDRRDSYNGWGQDNGRGRYNGGEWFRW